MKPIELANKYLTENHSVADNDFQNAMNIAVMKAFLAGYNAARMKAQMFLYRHFKPSALDNSGDVRWGDGFTENDFIKFMGE